MFGRKNSHGQSRQRRCIACDELFFSMEQLEGMLGNICWQCRSIMGVSTERQAEEMVSMFDLNELHQRSVTVHQKAPEKPKLDPEKVAAGIRTQVDYKVGPVREYSKPITYECAKNGLFEVRHSDLATIITKPKDVLGLTHELKEGMTLNLPKIPFLMLQQTISFFRAVEQKMKSSSEALVQIWWDRTDKVHILHVPEQQVSGGSVRHSSAFDREMSGRYFHVADIHSHTSTMSAFWSGVDDADERKVTTERLFGVIGKISQPIPEWKWRMRTRDGFMDLNVTDIFQMPQESFSFTVKSEDLFRTVNDPNTFKDGRAQLWCPVAPFANVEIPQEWLDQVKSYSYNNNQAGFTGHQRGLLGTISRASGIRGYIWISNEEFEVDGESIKPTGQKLLPASELPRFIKKG